MKMMKRALSTLLAGVFAASMCALPAFATSASMNPSGPTRMYTVDIYGGNNGTVNGEEHYTASVPAGALFDFSSIEVVVNQDVSNKYYVKGIRDASVNNAYTKDFVRGVGVVELSDTTCTFTGSMKITEDTDLVVAYGIKSQRVNYTVRYVDRAGNEIADPDIFVGDIGDRPAPAVKYIEGYLPQAMVIDMPPLKGGEENVVTFDYARIDPTYRTIYENETIYIITPEGEQVPVTPVTPEEAAAGAVPVVTEAGETILDADGNPLAAPIDEENLDDNANPLASANGEAGISTQAADAASILSWLLPLLAAVVVAGLVVFFALLIRNKRKDNENS